MSRKAQAKAQARVTELEAERLRRQAAEIAAIVSEQARLAGAQARLLAEQGRVWATPRWEAAGAWAAPKVDKAWRETVKVTAPRVEAATERVRPAVDNAYERIVDDYLPRVQRAMHDAADAAAKGETIGAKAGLASAAARKALTEPPKKPSFPVGKTLGWVLVGTAAAGTGYLLWRRSQPVDDPWAEEYWDDTTVSTPPTTAAGAGSKGSDVKTKIAGAASAVTHKATEVAGKASEVAGKAAEKVRKNPELGQATTEKLPGTAENPLGSTGGFSSTQPTTSTSSTTTGGFVGSGAAGTSGADTSSDTGLSATGNASSDTSDEKKDPGAQI